MPVDHPAHQYTYENLKKQGGVVDKADDIHINRRDEPEKKEDAWLAETTKAVDDLKVNGDSAAVKA